MTRRSLFILAGFALFFCFQIGLAPTALAKHGQGHGEGKGHDEHEKHHGKSDDKDKGDKEKGPKVKHRGLDANGDGVISREEWRGNDVSFRNQDWNNDGRLTGDELRPGAKRPPQQNDQDERARLEERRREEERRLAEHDLLRRLDTNRDGVISRYEFQGGNDLFDRLDRNRDAILTRDELLRMDAEQGLASSLMGKVKDKIRSFINWLF